MVTYLHDAIAACEQALDHQLATAPACQQLGNVLQATGRFAEAIDWHSRGLQSVDSDTHPADLYTGLGNLYANQEQWHQAITAYQKAVTHNPRFAKAYWDMGDSFAQLQQPLAAIDAWFQALALEPHQATADAYCDLGNFFLKGGNLDRAVMCYQQALQLNSRLSEAYHNLGESLMGLERWDEAIACYQEAIRHDPEPGWAYYKLGNVLSMQTRLDEAVEAYRQAIGCTPDFPWSYHNLVELLLRQAQWQEAIAFCRKALTLEQEHAWAHTLLGRSLLMVGEVEEAIACHQRACWLRDWHQCSDKEYQFTQDWFSHNISSWKTALEPFAHQSGVTALEIGSFQGMSACWLLDHILTHPSAQIICIDPAFQPEFELNLPKTGALEKLKKYNATSQDTLPTLPVNSCDIVYIDGCHLADFVYQDAMLSWQLLKTNGVLIFDDYQWQDPNFPGQEPKLGIDRFLAEHSAQIELLHKHYQVILKKV